MYLAPLKHGKISPFFGWGSLLRKSKLEKEAMPPTQLRTCLGLASYFE